MPVIFSCIVSTFVLYQIFISKLEFCRRHMVLKFIHENLLFLKEWCGFQACNYAVIIMSQRKKLKKQKTDK